jgi:AraC-like DNA-binding protein
MILYIKNMVSERCRMIVKSEIEKLGLHLNAIELCELSINEDLSLDQHYLLNSKLKNAGFDLLEDKRSILIEKIKLIIIELVHYSEEQLKINFSDFLSEKLKYDYTYLANLFSENQGTTIEHFFISHKIERVKELLLYDELNITEIANKMHYSSAAHLSNQFRKMTGLTPSTYKHLKVKRRQSLENV